MPISALNVRETREFPRLSYMTSFDDQS